MRDFLFKKIDPNDRYVADKRSLDFNRKNRRYKRLIKFDKTHNWHLLNFYGKRIAANIFSIYKFNYICNKCNYLKVKMFDQHTPFFQYVYGDEGYSEFNCLPCDQVIIKNILT